MKSKSLLLVLLFLALAATGFAQTLVDITGNSIAQFQLGFQKWEFPSLPADEVNIWGADGFTCSDLLHDQYILEIVPADSQVIVLIDSTNDIGTGVPVNVHMNCMYTTLSLLQSRNSAVRIVVANTPPWTQWNPCLNNGQGGDNDPSIATNIEAYNAAYADPVNGLEAKFQHVMVADVWTPAVQPDGWAYPQYMQGPCGIHPDQAETWSASWDHFAWGYENLVLTGLQQQW